MSEDLAVATLLAVGIAAVLLAGVGALVARELFDRLHYVSVATSLGALAVAIAVALAAGWSGGGFKVGLTGALVVLTGPLLTHATARAARLREERSDGDEDSSHPPEER